MNENQQVHRRQFLKTTALISAVSAFPPELRADENPGFELKYALASCMYGYTALDQIVPEVKKIGATALDIWPKVHGNQREQLDEMGEEKFRELLKKHGVKLGCITQYKLGPFGLQKEMQLAKRLGCQLIVTGARGPKNLKGDKLKAAVKEFAEKLKPHLAVAKEMGVTIAIENHGGNLLDTPDGMKWLMDVRPSKNLKIALAPYHLEQDEKLLSDLIRTLGNRIAMFYAWQHGMGCMKKLPKEQELLQMPGRGKLDFVPLLSALRDVKYNGWTEIFMHPVPRGIPILKTTDKVTEEMNRSRTYLAECLKKI